MNALFQLLSPLRYIQTEPFVKTSIPFLKNLAETNTLLSQHAFTPSQYKHSSKKKPYLISFIQNNFALLKSIPFSGSLLIFFKFNAFSNKTFEISLQIPKPKNKFESSLSFLEKFLDITINWLGNENCNTLVLTFLHNYLKMNFYLFALPLTIVILISLTSLVFLLLILPTSPMIIIIMIKALNLLLLSDHTQRVLLKFLLLTVPSDVSSQTILSSSNVLIYTHDTGDLPANLDSLLRFLSMSPLLLNLQLLTHHTKIKFFLTLLLPQTQLLPNSLFPYSSNPYSNSSVVPKFHHHSTSS